MKNSDSYEERPERKHSSFPHFDDKYKCCCGTVHVRQGAQMVGIVSAILTFISLFHGAFAKEGTSTHVVEFICLGIEILCIVLLLVGISKYKAVYLLPFMIFSVLSLVFALVLFCLTVYSVVNPHTSFGNYLREAVETQENADLRKELSSGDKNFDPDMMVRIVSVFIATALLIGFVLNAWWLQVVYRCYRYLRDLQQHRRHHSTVSFNVEAATVH